MANNNIVQIIAPNQGLTVTEIVIGEWYKKVGDNVEKGEEILQYESDKAVFQLESPADGKLSKIVAEEGDTIPIGGIIGEISTS